MCVYLKDILRQGKTVSAQTKDSRILYDRLFSTIFIITSAAAVRPAGLDIPSFVAMLLLCNS